MSAFQKLGGWKGPYGDGAGASTGGANVARAKTIHEASGHRRHVTDVSAYGAPTPDDILSRHAGGGESPLYTPLDQNLHRHTSLPSRAKATAWRGQSMSALPGSLFEDSDPLDEEGSSYTQDVARQWADLRGTSHQRSISEADGSRSGSGSSPTSPRTDNGVFASGAFASSSSGATVRRHQSLNLHQQRARSASNFGPIGSPSKTAQYRSGRPRVSSVGEEDIQPESYDGGRGMWSPTPEEAAQLHTRHEHSGSDDSHASLPSPTAGNLGLESKLAGLSIAAPLPSLTTEDLPTPQAGEEPWVVTPKLQPPQGPPSRKQTPQLSPLKTDFASTSPSGALSAGASVPWVGRNHASAPRDSTHISPVKSFSKGMSAAPGAAADAWSRERDRLFRAQPMHPGAYATAPPISQAPGYPMQGMPQQYYTAEQAQTAALLQQQQLQIQQLQAQVNARHGIQHQQASWGSPGQMPPALGNASSLWHMPGQQNPAHHGIAHQHANSNGAAPSPVDVSAFAQNKGFNPPPHLVDLQPPNARFFVIKSYTEEDVHKSIKYSIWTSTALGNKRLDKAFREATGKIFLFFSVNSSGHFCGVAEMLTPVDETIDATVWAQSKWKGVLKVRWLYIRDVPNSVLRHIRLTNTPEAKPVTSSRDTQEVPYEAGLEILRIFSNYNSKTSLLQDYQFYDVLQLQRQLSAALATDANGNDTTTDNGHTSQQQQQQQAALVPAQAIAPRRAVPV